jgi:cobalamin synthase
MISQTIRSNLSRAFIFASNISMKERVDREKSAQTNRTIGLFSLLAFVLALLIAGTYYGCAKASRPERPSSPPTPSGMSMITVLPPSQLTG